MASLATARQQWGGRLVLSEEVEHALQHGNPVVALESTIITHGMPHPTNLSTAQSLESILRSRGVTPATIALHSGKVHVGVSQAQLEELADTSAGLVKKVKVSRRDIAPTLAKGLIGGTTVAGTMYVARTVGIGMFVTGGIGGVHRGAEKSMDVSADLIELGRTPMAVICAGAKSILDIPRTLEVLETQGVCVATYGDKPDFPAFYTPSSGQTSPWAVKNASEAASLIHASLTLPDPLSTLLAVPIPSIHTPEGEKVQQAVEQAVRESIEQGIDKRGKEVTPWLLKRVGELSGGIALQLNVKLIENNARVGADVAVELARLQRESAEHAQSANYYFPPSQAATLQNAGPGLGPSPSSIPASSSSPIPLPPPSVLVFGSAALDITSQSPITLVPGTTTPGPIHLTPGGVGRNIAEAAQNLLPAGTVKLVSPMRGDEAGEMDMVGRVTRLEMEAVGLRTDGLVTVRDEGGAGDTEEGGAGSAACTLHLGPEGDLVSGVADMGIVERLAGEDVTAAVQGSKPRMIVFDCNPTSGTISSILSTAYEMDIDTFCDPTSTPKLRRLLPALASLLPTSPTARRPLTHLSPNTLELSQLHALLSDLPGETSNPAWDYVNSLNLQSDWRARLEAFGRKEGMSWVVQEGIVQQAVGVLPFVQSLWIKAGQRGVIHLRIATSPAERGGEGSSSTSASISHKLDGAHQRKYLVLSHHSAPVIKPEEVISTTGAGDTLVGGLVAGLVDGKGSEEEWVRRALDGVGRSLRSKRAVG
ncbi:Indigoidine synthase A like protein-domain-containing protein [Dioszegia hungarica]|uniref:Indigoidine synthase A like protein-domain-containing protein n=1 Tax=Dioszegia hungarica TaxID=4972 RepID=A0AA38H3W7_9TREE|nr:Indigoidine synthase A like protein-domain-containing protein [Dioszegia hungarica]KAI9632359.1 Indigoidine synthase A like protein-domain-containing protein [Dioszegia hungarica]